MSPDRDHQFTGLITADAGQGPYIQYLALEGLAVEVFAAAAPNAQRRALSGCGQNLLGERAGDGVHVLHGVDVSGRPAQPD